MKPTKLIVVSVISVLWCTFLIPAFNRGYPIHAGWQGSLVAVTAFLICLWAFLFSDRKPWWGKGILLIILGLSFALAFAVIFVSEKTKYLIKWKGDIKAFKQIKRAAARHGSSVAERIVLAHSYWVRANLRKAKKTFESVINLDRRHTEALISIAKIEIERDNDLPAATEYLQSAHMHDPDNPEVISLLASILLVEDKPEGVSLAKRAMLAEPENTDVPQYLADYFVRQEKYTEALEVLMSLQSSEASVKIAPFLQKKIDFMRRFSTDRGFRQRHKLKSKLMIVVGWLLLLLALLFVCLEVVVFIRDITGQ